MLDALRTIRAQILSLLGLFGLMVILWQVPVQAHVCQGLWCCFYELDGCTQGCQGDLDQCRAACGEDSECLNGCYDADAACDAGCSYQFSHCQEYE
jgi:hypothetical protein